MKVLRTPDSRFENLPGYPFAPNYLQITDDLRMHYVDEGPKDAQVVLMLHGEPSWSYLYRKMIPPVAEAGYRVIAPDLIGFGKSDKPSKISDYSYQTHMDWLNAFLDAMELDNIILFCQDWGSLLGLRLVGEQPDRFARVMLSNGALTTGEQKMPPAFTVWKTFAQYSPIFPIGKIIDSATVTDLPKDVIAAYNAPFPSAKYKAGTRAFPLLVPASTKDPASAACIKAKEGLSTFEKPFLTVFGKADPVLGKADKPMRELIPGSKDQPHDRIYGGHFVQEDCGEELAQRLIDWCQA
ncbi:MAG: haloalkane dehalogenase [Gammaproteobacteria bacterium]|nr:haloalkane dehalogenase [Gammaproteobacteria bacterium]